MMSASKRSGSATNGRRRRHHGRTQPPARIRLARMHSQAELSRI